MKETTELFRIRDPRSGKKLSRIQGPNPGSAILPKRDWNQMLDCLGGVWGAGVPSPPGTPGRWTGRGYFPGRRCPNSRESFCTRIWIPPPHTVSPKAKENVYRIEDNPKCLKSYRYQVPYLLIYSAAFSLAVIFPSQPYSTLYSRVLYRLNPKKPKNQKSEKTKKPKNQKNQKNLKTKNPKNIAT